MEDKQLTELDILIETHVDMDRQGPGSPEMTLKALSFIENLGGIQRAADLGCGTGGQTMIIARQIKGRIIGLDLFPEFIDVFNANANKLNLSDKAEGTVGHMEKLNHIFNKDELELIWSEGAIDGIGFEKGLRHWHAYLKRGGYVAVTCPSWLSAERIPEVERFWGDAGSKLDAVGDNISTMQKCGYSFAAAFALDEKCWTNNYFIPRAAKEEALLAKYAGNALVEAYVKNSRCEAELYSKYKRHYGYVFYIGRKM